MNLQISNENHEANISKQKQNISQRDRIFGTDLTNSLNFSLPSDRPNFKHLSEYAEDIYEYLHQAESQYLAKPGYMVTQESINEKMRSILIDWLVEVHFKLKLLEETLFLTVNIIDRYLERTQTDRTKLQLVGVSSLLIACKYEEIYPPEIKDFVFITDKAYSADQIIETENKILKSLEFNLTTPSAFRFLQRYAFVSEFDEYSFNLARYITELSLVEYKLLKYKPSNIAASALYIAQRQLKTLSKSFYRFTPCSDAEIRLCAKELLPLLHRAETHALQAVRKKFLHERNFEVAKIEINY